MKRPDLKHTLRELKHLEAKLTQDRPAAPHPLVWDSFFNLKENESSGKARYPLRALAAMDHAQFKAVLDEYWAFVYAGFFQENDSLEHIEYDAGTLLQLDLPFDANEQAVKKRFRELAKRYHPDTGGDAAQFVALMEAYRKLIRK